MTIFRQNFNQSIYHIYDTFIYFGIKAYGNPDDIRGQVKTRDQAEYENEDMIFLRIDPFGDKVKLYFRIKCIWKSS